MKRIIISSALVIVFILTLLFVSSVPENKGRFTVAENGNIVSPDGVEYKLLDDKGVLWYLGDIEFLAYVEGEKKTAVHYHSLYQTGVFSLKSASNDNILIRYRDYYGVSVYRKASLPDFDYSVDNIIRLEDARSDDLSSLDITHVSCGKGIVGKEAVAEFLSEIKKQPTAKEAGLYEMITKPGSNGLLENCLADHFIQGYYAEEPLLVRPFLRHNFNNLAYSLAYDGAEHVLPEEMMNKLKG